MNDDKLNEDASKNTTPVPLPKPTGKTVAELMTNKNNINNAKDSWKGKKANRINNKAQQRKPPTREKAKPNKEPPKRKKYERKNRVFTRDTHLLQRTLAHLEKENCQAVDVHGFMGDYSHEFVTNKAVDDVFILFDPYNKFPRHSGPRVTSGGLLGAGYGLRVSIDDIVSEVSSEAEEEFAAMAEFNAKYEEALNKTKTWACTKGSMPKVNEVFNHFRIALAEDAYSLANALVVKEKLKNVYSRVSTAYNEHLAAANAFAYEEGRQGAIADSLRHEFTVWEALSRGRFGDACLAAGISKNRALIASALFAGGLMIGVGGYWYFSRSKPVELDARTIERIARITQHSHVQPTSNVVLQAVSAVVENTEPVENPVLIHSPYEPNVAYSMLVSAWRRVSKLVGRGVAAQKPLVKRASKDLHKLHLKYGAGAVDQAKSTCDQCWCAMGSAVNSMKAKGADVVQSVSYYRDRYPKLMRILWFMRWFRGHKVSATVITLCGLWITYVFVRICSGFHNRPSCARGAKSAQKVTFRTWSKHRYALEEQIAAGQYPLGGTVAFCPQGRERKIATGVSDGSSVRGVVSEKPCDPRLGCILWGVGYSGIRPFTAMSCRHNEFEAITGRVTNRIGLTGALVYTNVVSVFSNAPLPPQWAFTYLWDAWWQHLEPAKRKLYKRGEDDMFDAYNFGLHKMFVKRENNLKLYQEFCARAIQGCTPVANLIVGPVVYSYTKTFVKFVNQYKHETISFLCPYGYSDTKLAAAILGRVKFPVRCFVEADGKRMDSTQEPVVNHCLTAELKRAFPGLRDTPWDAIMAANIPLWGRTRPTKFSGPMYYSASHGLGSGVQWTTINHCLFMWCLVHYCPPPFKVLFCNKGDDVWIASSARLETTRVWFQKYERLCNQCGLVLTKNLVAHDFQSEFLAMRPIITPDGVAMVPKLGRFLPKLGWSAHPFKVFSHTARAKSVADGLKHLMHIPVISDVIRCYARLGDGTEDLGSDWEYKSVGGVAGRVSESEYYDRFLITYGLTRHDIAKFSELIANVEHLPCVVESSLMESVLKVDMGVCFDDAHQFC
jgi:hypothetical protein